MTCYNQTSNICSARELFRLVGEENQQQRCQALWKNLQFDPIDSYIAVGTSFRQGLISTTANQKVGWVTLDVQASVR
jgi:hypothetical protein